MVAPARQVVTFFGGGTGGGTGRIVEHAPENHANSQTVVFSRIVLGAPLVAFGTVIGTMTPHAFGQDVIGHCIAVRLVLGLCTTEQCACVWAQSRHSVAFGAKWPCQVGEFGIFGYVQLEFWTHSGAIASQHATSGFGGGGGGVQAAVCQVCEPVGRHDADRKR